MAEPRNARSTKQGRTYMWRDEEFLSVTNILSKGIPKCALQYWAARTVAEYVTKNVDRVSSLAKEDPAAAIDLMKGAPNRQADAAAAKGSDVHAAVEAWVLGQPQPEFPDAIAPMMGQFAMFLEEFKPTIEMSEATVYSRKHHYAGTLDSIMVIGDTRLLVDVKTGKGIYGDQVATQLAAYRFADFVGMPDGTEQPMPSVDGCAVLHLRPKTYQFVPVVADDTIFRYFLYAQQISQWCEDVSRSVLLAPASPGDFA